MGKRDNERMQPRGHTGPTPSRCRPTCVRRKATVKAVNDLVVLALDRQTFVDVLGPLQAIMDKEKSAEVCGGSWMGVCVWGKGHSSGSRSVSRLDGLPGRACCSHKSCACHSAASLRPTASAC